MKKVGIITFHASHNYGSMLQAYALQQVVLGMGYDCEIINFRSVAQKEMYKPIFMRGTLYGKCVRFIIQATYALGILKKYRLFEKFLKENLILSSKEYNTLKDLENADFNYDYFISGSDQIWNSTTLYVDPLYYLRFAPSYKRVALAPSFGRDYIADYNRSKMSIWISDYPYISVREKSGVSLIEEMTGRKAQHLLDPTLVITSEEWKKFLEIKEHKRQNYILAYFLDEPSDYARLQLLKLKNEMGCEIKSIPFIFKNMEYSDASIAAGPKEFVSLIANARLVCTDSFHGTAFSLNMHTPFYTFEREYGAANKQSERILSILSMVGMMQRYEPHITECSIDEIDFNYSDLVLSKEREKVYEFVQNAILDILNHEK